MRVGVPRHRAAFERCAWHDRAGRRERAEGRRSREYHPRRLACIETVSVFVLPAEWRLHLSEMPSLRLGACDRSGQPHVGRALAADVSPDGHMFVLLAEHSAPRVVTALRETGQVALLATSPRTNRTLHVKGRGASVRSALDAHAELLAARRAALDKEISEVDGFAKARFLDHWYDVAVHEMVAVHFSVTGAWNQTPGPDAGQPLGLERTS